MQHDSATDQMVKLNQQELDQLSEHIAQIVEDRILHKAMRLLAANLSVMLAALAAGLGAYFTLHADVRENRSINALQDRRMDEISAATATFRALIDAKLDGLNTKFDNRFDQMNVKVDELNRYLRDRNVRPPS